MSLKQKTIKGLFWSFISQGGRQVSQFVVTIILARLLKPNDFGLLAMATVFTNFAMIFSELGISSALIQKQDTHDRHYYSAFWLNVAVGSSLTLLFITLAPLISGFYKRPELKPILMVLSINFFLSSFVIIQQTILTKEMDFKKLAVRDILSVIFSGGVGIVFAYNGFGVWSLVAQSLTFTLSSVLLLWTVSPWRPKFEFAKADIKDIFNFSANLTGFNIVNYFARNVDQLLIGRFLGSQALGYYSLAYKIMLYPLQNISQVIGKVMFPAFAKMQRDLARIRKAYLNVIKVVSQITFPMMASLFILAPEFVKIIFGIQWLPVIALISILWICSIAQSIGTTVGNIYLSIGKPDIQFKFTLFVTVPTAILAVLLGVGLGDINKVAISYTIRSIIVTYLNLMIVSRVINLNQNDLFQSLKGSSFLIIIIATVGIIARWTLTTFLNITNPRIMLLILFMLCCLIYVLFLSLCKIVNIRKHGLVFLLGENN